MPIEVIQFDQAQNIYRKNGAKGWPNRADLINRIEPFATPVLHPSFAFNTSDSVFTIGSCFARNVEGVLARHGFSVPMLDVDLSTPETQNVGRGILNNYGVSSILNELTWALDAENPFDPERHLVKIGDDKYIDLHLAHAPRPLSLDECMHRRTNLKNAYENVKKCNVVVITLGLIEIWFDKYSKCYLNIMPPRSILLDSIVKRNTLKQI